MSTIVAISTPYGSGGIAVIRLSGSDALAIADRVWRGSGLSKADSHTAHLGIITDTNGDPLDQAVATIFLAPGSYTGEDTVEFSTHGSKWIQRRVVERLVEVGALPAEPGEFTRRAFMNGRLDLAQAEGVADLIAASSRAAHRLAMSQVAGGFSARLNQLRDKLIDLGALLELELDFSEEDVEFADRSQLLSITDETLSTINRLISTYAAGRAFKEGVPVAIAGQPNAGKSTLLNLLLGEEKAIVTDTPGTTRDVIEDTCEIDGILFRFFDTAGLRETTDTVEKIGIDRARDTIARASIVLWTVDTSTGEEETKRQISEINIQVSVHPDSRHILLLNKTDILQNKTDQRATDITPINTDVSFEGEQTIEISAKTGIGIESLKRSIVGLAKKGHDPESELILTNARHHAALSTGAESLARIKEGITNGQTADIIAQDLREALHHIGTVTGTVTTDTLLTAIFSRFCIGK